MLNKPYKVWAQIEIKEIRLGNSCNENDSFDWLEVEIKCGVYLL